MGVTVAKYTFGSWMRKGIAANINEVDNLGMGTSSVLDRPTIPIDIAINSQPVHKDFDLLGPGDVIGINPQMIVRTEPKNWITDFEPNYFPFVEFFDEGFLWRYSPARPNGNKLRPWVALIVLRESNDESEQEFTKDDKRLPLPTVTVKSASALPPNNETWAWAHVHTNNGHEADSEFEEFLQSLHNLNDPNADKIISRLVCPRRLEVNSAYRAFVIPAFETGRMAGLGQDTSTIDAQQPAWNETSDGVEFPVYYEWYFRTGENEDFESLVKLLEPRIVDSRVGIRDMDGSKPGFGMTEGTDIGAVIPNFADQRVIGLEGALKAPATISKPESLDLSKPYFSQLKDILNFPEALRKQSNTSKDPVVSPPIYGENHALTHEININHSGWLHTLNKDPRNRVPSGFGTSVIQKDQENFMAKAWEQVQTILEANKKILRIVFSMTFAVKVQENFVSKLKPSGMITFFSPVLKKVKGSPTTLFFQMQHSKLPTTAVSSAFRRITRPRGAYFKKMKKADPEFDHSSLIENLNKGNISPAPPKETPKGIYTTEQLHENLPAAKFGALLKWLIKHRLLLLILLLIIFALIGLFTGMWALAITGAVITIVVYVYLKKLEKRLKQLVAAVDPTALIDVIQTTAAQSSFQFTETNPVVPPATSAGTSVTQTTEATSTDPNAFTLTTFSTNTNLGSGTDSLEANNFRVASLKLNTRLSFIAPDKERTEFDLDNATVKLTEAVNPKVIFPKQLASLVYFSFNPAWLLKPEHLVPAMAYPDFEDPMYEKLRDISSELLIPNLNLIPPNTISLLVTNAPFIESYMVGLNHEFGKELLWREFPTDKRGSYFRQFWDVKGIVNNESGLSQEELTEKYKDITPLDTWTSTSKLGGHSNRNIHGDKQLVLVVRGDLLKKYPNTIIYAQKARIFKDEKGVADGTKEPVIVEVQTAEQMAAEIKFPQFKADIDPDFKFFGFDLTMEQAKGDDDPSIEADDWGYYFVIQQIPGAPRFGMDIEFDPDDDNDTPITWDDMAWTKYDNGEDFVKTSVLPDASFTPAGANETRSQWGNDAATMAYILYQKPVMIAIHAKEMLTDL